MVPGSTWTILRDYWCVLAVGILHFAGIHFAFAFAKLLHPEEGDCIASCCMYVSQFMRKSKKALGFSDPSGEMETAATASLCGWHCIDCA
jgi:hypothetical protein